MNSSMLDLCLHISMVHWSRISDIEVTLNVCYETDRFAFSSEYTNAKLLTLVIQYIVNWLIEHVIRYHN